MKSEDSVIKELKRKLRKAKKEKEIVTQQMLFLAAWFREALRFAPSDFVLPHDVCALLYHPLKENGFCFCQSEFVMHSGQIIQKAEVVVQKECEKSLSGKHCFHQIVSNVVIPGRSVLDQVCCFCGKTEHTEVELPSSYTYSYDSSKHGSFAPVYQVLY